jgi:biopolymer transport protein ExbB
MLTTKLLTFTLFGAEWVLWLLIALSVVSIGMMIERLFYFSTHRLLVAAELPNRILRGELEQVKQLVGRTSGLQASVVREGLAFAPMGAEAVEEVMAATMAREKKRYERGLAFLGTLGNNAPFVGLFGTVLGIIRAFHDLAASNSANAAKAAAGAATVMSGISEALVATAVGLFVAIPAVVAFNTFNRWVKTLTASAQELSHAIVAQLRATAERATAQRAE